VTREGKRSYLEQIKTHKDNNNQKKETYKPNTLKSIAYPSPSCQAKPNHGWSPGSFVNDLPKPRLASQTRKPLLPVPIPSRASLASSFCSLNPSLPVGKSLTQRHVDARNKSKQEDNPRCAFRHPSLRPAEMATATSGLIYLTQRFPRDRATPAAFTVTHSRLEGVRTPSCLSCQRTALCIYQRKP